MTPKEKAKDLFDKMVVYHWTDVCDYEGAKLCALIAVEEMIKMLKELESEGFLKPNSAILIIQEVEKEINNL